MSPHLESADHDLSLLSLSPSPGPCSPSPCKNDGSCEVITSTRRGDVFSEYVCKCQPGFEGAHCQISKYLPQVIHLTPDDAPVLCLPSNLTPFLSSGRLYQAQDRHILYMHTHAHSEDSNPLYCTRTTVTSRTCTVRHSGLLLYCHSKYENTSEMFTLSERLNTVASS